MSLEVWRARLYLFAKRMFVTRPSKEVIVVGLAATSGLAFYFTASFWHLAWTIFITNLGIWGMRNLHSEGALLAFENFLLEESRKPDKGPYYLLVAQTLKELKIARTKRATALLEEAKAVADRHAPKGTSEKKNKAQLKVEREQKKLENRFDKMDEKIDGLIVENKILEIQATHRNLEETEKILDEVHENIELQAIAEAQTVDGLIEDKTDKGSPEES